MPDSADIKIGYTTFVDVEDDRDVAAVVVGDQRRVKTTTPFGQQVDLILHLATRHGLTRLAHFAALDNAAPLEGWTFTRDGAGLATVHHPGPEKHFLHGDLGDDERWWTAAADRSHVKLLVLGDPDLVRHHLPGTDILDGLNAAASRGLLAGGMVAFVGAAARHAAIGNVDPERLRIHGITLTGQRGRFTLNISRPEAGLTGTIELTRQEAIRIASDLVKTLDANPGALVNISAIVREHTGRDLHAPV